MGYVAALFPPAPAPGVPGDRGVLSPNSEAWRIGRERVLLAGGPAALLLQVAHPLVAAGVAEHSGFQADPLRRLRATLDATLAVFFGDSSQAHAAAARVAGRHRHVVGNMGSGVGRFPAGTSYRAADPHLALWVHATLVWTALELYDGFVAPLSAHRRAAYLAETSRFAQLFGVPEELLPRGYGEFEGYVREMTDDVLEVGPQARALSEELLQFGAAALGHPLSGGVDRLTRVLAAGFLPDRLRAGYGLSWGRGEQRAFAALRLASRAALPVMPRTLRYWPHYTSAQRRLRT